MISLRGVDKTYLTRDGPVPALRGVSLDVADGEFVSIVGPSGCGKSTLLMIVAGLTSADPGSVVEVGGRAVTRPVTELGIVFQDPILLDWRSVLDNVLLQAEIRRLDLDGHRKRALELLRMVGLGGFEQKRPFELSGGMRQRTSICRALVHDPRLLLMDEPFGALDEITRQRLNGELLRICALAGWTVVFVTHNVFEAVFLSSRILVMSRRPGRIVAEVPVDLPYPRVPELRTAPEYSRIVAQVVNLLEEA